MKKNNKKLFGVLAIVCLLSVAGISAYFTDKEVQNAKATAGNIDLVWKNAETNLSGAAENVVWEDQFDADEIMNPGDTYDFSYSLENKGNKSIDVKQQLTLVSSVELTADAEEYTLTITGGNDSDEVTGVVSDDKKTITYDLKDIVLDGSIETEAGSVGTNEDYTVKLNFDLAAKNAFMDSTVELTYNAWAKQHRNAPDADWANIAKYEKITTTAGN